MTQRTDVLGMEFETTLSGFGIRGEAAWYENESFLTSSLTSTANHTFSTMSFALIALSWGLIFLCCMVFTCHGGIFPSGVVPSRGMFYRDGWA